MVYALGKTTGMALVREAGPKAESKAEVVSLIELEQRGEKINKKLKPRAAFVPTCETGDQAKAQVPKGNKQETYPGPGPLRETGSLNLKTSTATLEGINHKHCRLIQRGDRLWLVTSSPMSNA